MQVFYFILFYLYGGPKRRMDGRAVSLSVVSVRGVHRSMGERTAMLHRNLKGGGIRDKPINTHYLVSCFVY